MKGLSLAFFVGSAWSFSFYMSATTANDFRLRRISIPDLIHYIIFLSYFLRNSQNFPFQCWVLNKWITGTIFITSLVWRGTWLGIERGTSCTRSQHSTPRLSRRRFFISLIWKSVWPQTLVQGVQDLAVNWKKPTQTVILLQGKIPINCSVYE